MGYRRWLIRERKAQALQAAKDAAKAEARHKRHLERREGTCKLAMKRIEACEKYPTPFAVQQLASIAENPDMNPQARVAAAQVLLRWGQGEVQ